MAARTRTMLRVGTSNSSRNARYSTTAAPATAATKRRKSISSSAFSSSSSSYYCRRRRRRRLSSMLASAPHIPLSSLIPSSYSPYTWINISSYNSNNSGVLTLASHRQLLQQHPQLHLKQRRHQQQQQQQQFRHYLYIPVEWSELKERFIRWVEKSEQRVVNVKLLSRRFAASDRRKKRKMRTNGDNNNNINISSSISPANDDFKNDVDDILYDIDYRNESPYSRKAALEAAAAATTPPGATPKPTSLPHSFTARSRSYLESTKRAFRGKKFQWKRRWRAHHRRRRLRRNRQLATNPVVRLSTVNSILSTTSLPLPVEVSALPTTKTKIRTATNIEDLRNRYLRWKARKTVDFHAWEARRLEQYVRWKQRRKDQMGRWNDKRHRAMVRTRQILLKEYSRPEWFCPNTGRPLTSRDSTGRFVNPWLSQSTNGIHSPWTILKWRWQRFERELKQVGVFGLLSPTWLPFLSSSSTQKPLLTESPLAYQSVPPLPTPSESALQCTWIGHATYLLHIDQDFTILVDPIFSVRCSPFQNSPIGVARDVPPSCTIEQLVKHHQSEIPRSRMNNSEVDKSSSDHLKPNNRRNVRRPIDLCCITHDHYDHLDHDSVLGLKDHVDTWVTPLVVGDWLVEKCGIDRHRVVQLEWWEQVQLRKRKDNVAAPVEIVSQGCMTTQGRDSVNPDRILAATTAANDDNDNDKQWADADDIGADLHEDLTITCCPASHWGSRALWDRNRRLWCSFALKTTSYNVFACGDTSYPEVFPLFRQIGDALGPFDLAALPIGAYGT